MKRAAAALVAVLALAPAGVPAHDPNTTSGVQVLQPGEVGLGQVQGKGHGHDQRSAASDLPGSAHRHIRQRTEYGKGYRYGHKVNGTTGDIIIWSPNATRGYGSPRPHFGSRYRSLQNPHPPTGPRLEYKPDYGKPKSGRD